MILDDEFWTLLDERPEEALKAAEDAVQADGASADAHFARGLACETLGRDADKESAYLETRRLDSIATAALPASIDEAVHSEAEKVLARLPPAVRKRLGPMKVQVERLPNEKLIEVRESPRPASLLQCSQEKEGDGSTVTVNGILLFSYVLNLGCEDEEELRAEVADTMIIQIGDVLELDDAEMDRLLEG